MKSKSIGHRAAFLAIRHFGTHCLGLTLKKSVCVHFSTLKSYNGEAAASDPMWACRLLLDQFIRKSASLAVLMGGSSLNENSCPAKAWSKVKTYSPTSLPNIPSDSMQLWGINTVILAPYLTTGLVSALWVCMMGHQTVNLKQLNGAKRFFLR